MLGLSVKRKLRQLRSDVAATRAAAVTALAEIGDPQAVPGLAELLQDEERALRVGAAQALGAIGHPSAVGPLIGALLAENTWEVRHEIVDALRKIGAGESSAAVRGRVVEARQILQASTRAIDSGVELTKLACPEGIRLLDRAADKLGLSARGYVKTLRTARTVAALDGRDHIAASDLAEAIQYRVLDRRHAA